MVMVHGDDNGLILPPRMAPCQAVVIPVYTTDNREVVAERAKALHASLVEAGIRARVDLDPSKSPGWKYNEWDLRGVPLRIEIGPKDMAKNQVCVARRDVADRAQKKAFIAQDAMLETVKRLLLEVQNAMFARAREFRDQNTRSVGRYEEFREIIENKRGFVVGPWAGSAEDEAVIKSETKATLRCFPLEQPETVGSCFYTGKPANRIAYFARAY